MEKIQPLSQALLPTKYGSFEIYTFPNEKGGEPHIALLKQDSKLTETLTLRIHSECLTGDILHSLRCDCGDQLDFGLKTVNDSLNGMLLYLRQEGRGIGLTDKIKAYALQEAGEDTISANLSLGHKADERDFTIAGEILNYFGISTVKLITNNPDKVEALEKLGIKIIERIATPKFKTKENEKYLETKLKKMGHYL